MQFCITINKETGTDFCVDLKPYYGERLDMISEKR